MPDATISVTKERPHLGVTLSTTTKGVRILDCNSADLFAAAGLSKGDIVTHIDGEAIDDHDVLLARLGKFKTSVVTYTPWPEAVPAAATLATAMSSVRLAYLFSVPCLMALGSIDLHTQLAPVLAVLFLGWPKSSACVGGRFYVFAGTFFNGFLIAAMGQEVRRCATDMCDLPTQYGTEDDCRAPCSSSFGRYLHWPALLFTVLASTTSLVASFHMQTAAEAHEVQTKSISKDTW